LVSDQINSIDSSYPSHIELMANEASLYVITKDLKRGSSKG
jgi:hypothetical protein